MTFIFMEGARDKKKKKVPTSLTHRVAAFAHLSSSRSIIDLLIVTSNAKKKKKKERVQLGGVRSP